MDRLTTKYLINSELYFPTKIIEDNSDCLELCMNTDKEGCTEDCPIQKCFKKLADYENAEEQGRLIKFPVSIGDHLWLLDAYGIIQELTVNELSISSRGQTMLADSIGLRAYYSLDHIGENIFYTREEAEAKREELQSMDAAVENFKQGKASEPIDLSDIKE